MDKQLTLNRLYEEYKTEYHTQEVVQGDGSVSCQLMLIGEAPGKDEVEMKKPFVGSAGGKLKEFIDYIDKTRNDFYVTNAIKYRLCQVNEKTKRKSNRPATLQEIKDSREYLMREIDIIQPKMIITLGNVPLKSLLGEYKVSIGNYHGVLVNVNGYRLFPLYHPASLLYNRALEETYYHDLDILKKTIKEILSC